VKYVKDCDAARMLGWKKQFISHLSCCAKCFRTCDIFLLVLRRVKAASAAAEPTNKMSAAAKTPSAEGPSAEPSRPAKRASRRSRVAVMRKGGIMRDMVYAA